MSKKFAKMVMIKMNMVGTAPKKFAKVVLTKMKTNQNSIQLCELLTNNTIYTNFMSKTFMRTSCEQQINGHQKISNKRSPLIIIRTY